MIDGLVVPGDEPSRPATIARVVGAGTLPSRVQTQVDRDRTLLFADEVLERISHGLAAETWRAYRQQWNRYLRWCERNGRTPLPATIETLLSYLNSMMREELAPTSVRLSMAALRKFHSFGNPPPQWLGEAGEVTMLIGGYERDVARDPDRAPKRSIGARSAIMRALVDTCDPSTTRGMFDRATLLLGYYMAGRSSEVRHLRLGDFRYTVDGLEARIAFSKTNQTGDEEWVALQQNQQHQDYDVVWAVQSITDLLGGQGIESGPLIRPVRTTGLIQHRRDPVSGTTISNIWDRAVTAARARYADLDTPEDRVMRKLLAGRITPHSGRRGFATDARAAGWDLLDITRHGRWSPQSKVVHIYIEEIDRWLRHQMKPVQL